MGQDWASLGVRPGTARRLQAGGVLLAVMLAGGWLAPSGPTGCLDELASGRATWAEAGLDDYTIVYEMWGFKAGGDPIEVVVVSGDVVSTSSDWPRAPTFTVEDLFDRAERFGEFARDGEPGDNGVWEYRCEAEWDDDYGFPRRITPELVRGFDGPLDLIVTAFSVGAAEPSAP